MGVLEILDEWLAWRTDCVRRRVYCDLSKKKEKLHLLYGLKKILLDIDEAIRIIRNTEEEDEVIPNLMIGFGIDELQAEYVAEIKLRNINKEYILRRTEETTELENAIKELEDVLASPAKVKGIIKDELKTVIKKFGADRKTQIVYEDETEEYSEEEQVDDYPVNIFLSREGYFKKITPLSLRMGGEQKYKENDGAFLSYEAQNRGELLVFTDKQQAYKARLRDFDDTKASTLGTYLPTFLSMDEGENVIFLLDPGDYSGHVLFFFENGKAARVELSAYATKTNRKKLTGAYSDKSEVKSIIFLPAEVEIAVYSAEGRALIFSSSRLSPKTTRQTQGVSVLTLKKKDKLASAVPIEKTAITNMSRYRMRSVPATGAILKEEDSEEKQLTLELDI